MARTFPMIPAFDFLPISFLGNLVWMPASIFVLLLLLGILFSGKRIFLYLSLFVGLVLILEDVNRLQVWFYQFSFMLLLVAMVERVGKERVYSNLQIVMICIYFWSGFNKLGVYYIEDTFPWLLEVIPIFTSLADNLFAAIVSALLEIAIGLGLLFKSTRNWAVGLAIILHLFILFVLGPFGHNWNQVVWPWNFCQMVLVYQLFYRKSSIGWRDTIQGFPFTMVVLCLFGLMPALNMIDKWPDQLSFKMYSGAYSEGVLYAESADNNCLPDHKETYQGRSEEGKPEKSLILDDWALSELGVTPFVNERFYYRLGMRYCACFEDASSAGISILTVDRWDRSKESFVRLPCEMIKK